MGGRGRIMADAMTETLATVAHTPRDDTPRPDASAKDVPEKDASFRRPLSEGGVPFSLVSDYQPAGD